VDRTQALSDLRSTLKRTLAAFAWSGRILGRSYGPGKWTGRQILAHLTQCELVFLTRLHYLLGEENPAIVPFDQDAWMKRFDPKDADVKPLKESFRMLREVFIDIAKSMSDAEYARRGRHPEHADYTAEYLVIHAAEHNARHLEQLDAIKAGRSWAPKNV